MKIIFWMLILATIITVVAKADAVTITFDQPLQTGGPGDTLEFFGTITNDSDAMVYLNGDDLTLDGLSFTISDQFFNTVPISLAPSGQAGDSSGDIELFDVIVSNPLLDANGTYSGSYDLTGGIDGNASDVLGSANFSVTQVPEPSATYLLLVGVGIALVPIWKKARTQG